jgi:hypothetical protein
MHDTGECSELIFPAPITHARVHYYPLDLVICSCLVGGDDTNGMAVTPHQSAQERWRRQMQVHALGSECLRGFMALQQGCFDASRHVVNIVAHWAACCVSCCRCPALMESGHRIITSITHLTLSTYLTLLTHYSHLTLLSLNITLTKHYSHVTLLPLNITLTT